MTELAQQIAAAKRLLGRRVAFAHRPEESFEVARVNSRDGMLELKGLSGEFAPHIFIEARERDKENVSNGAAQRSGG
jgi:hypothetical protein